MHDLLKGYDDSLFLLEDYDFWVRAYLKGFHFLHIDKTPYKYRRHGSSLTESSKIMIMSETIRYRYNLRKKLRLSINKALSMRIGLLKEGWKILSLKENLNLLYEILGNLPGFFLNPKEQ